MALEGLTDTRAGFVSKVRMTVCVRVRVCENSFSLLSVQLQSRRLHLTSDPNYLNTQTHAHTQHRGAWSVSNQAIQVWGLLSQLLDHCSSGGGEGLMGVEVTGQIIHASHASVLVGLAQVRVCVCVHVRVRVRVCKSEGVSFMVHAV